MTLASEGKALRAAGVVLAACLSLAALANAWAATTRTTAASIPNYPGVFRENLVTGKLEFCTIGPQGGIFCFADRAPGSTPQPTTGG